MDTSISNRSSGPAMRPGHQRISLKTPTIQATCWHVPIPSEEGSEAASKRGEMIDHAWRRINETDSIDTDGAREMAGPCAVIQWNEGGEAELWVFEPHAEGGEQGGLLDDSGLERTESRVIDVRRLVTCSTHGHDLLCLGNDRKCDVKWTFGEFETCWHVYAKALRDKAAWRAGRRVESSKERCEVWPVSPDQLVLIVKPAIETTRRPSVNGGSRIPAVSLDPLSLRAIHVGTYDPTPSQASSLDKAFSEALGAVYTMSRGDPHSLFNLDAQLGYAQPRWGVYWVCEDLEPEPRIDELKNKTGVMTIWPTALVSPLQPLTPLWSPRSDSVRAIPAREFPDPSDLMSVATGLFDFISSYEPPIEGIEDITPETHGNLDSPLITEDHSNTDHPVNQGTADTQPLASDHGDVVSGNGDPESPAGSDMDDLFGDHSPTPPVANESLPVIAADEDHTMDYDQDIVMSSPSAYEPPPVAVLPNSTAQSVNGGTNPSTEAGEPAFVTEDDFAFFDSPPDGEDSSAQNEMSGSWLEDLQNAAAESMPADDLDGAQDFGEPEPEQSGGDGSSESFAPLTSPEAVPSQTQPVQERQRDDSTDTFPHQQAREQREPTPRDDLPAPPPRKTVTFAKSPTPPPPPVALPVESVPSPFGPLDIEPSVSSYAYSLPTPAASPETNPPLRSDLLARLQSSLHDKNKYDYASTWDVESDVSDVEEEEDFSGAPPTPVSFIDTDTQPSMIPTPKMDVLGESAEITWEGVGLVGPEWVGMRWEKRTSGGQGKVWKDSWAKGKTLTANAEVKDVKLDAADWERLVEEVIASRHLRSMLLESGTLSDGSASDQMSATSIESLASADPSRPLPHCQIHVGYGGNVCQLSIASLRYWAQLGLQPVGGPKDIKALIVCSSESGTVRVAKTFLQRIGATYEGCKLGRHTTGESAAAREGVIALPPNGFVDAIAGLMSSAPDNTVVYVLLPLLARDALADLVGKLLSTKLPAVETAFIKLIPPSALDLHAAESIAFEVYDKLLRPVRPISLRGVPMQVLDPRSSVQYPSWTVSPDAPVKPDLTLAWPLRSYDALNRWRMVHCAYAVDTAAKRAVGFATDDQGEGWDVRTLSVGENGPGAIVEGLWGFFKEFAGRASAEYRLVVCCVGTISKIELDAWRALMDASKMPASLMLVNSSTNPTDSFHPRSAPVPIPPSTFADPSTRIIDDSLAGHTTVLPRLPVQLSQSHDLVIPKSSFSCTIKTPSSGHATSTYDVFYHVPPEKAAHGVGFGLKGEDREKEKEKEEDMLEVLAGSVYRLMCLGRMRFGMETGGDAVHVRAVQLGLQAVDLIV